MKRVPRIESVLAALLLVSVASLIGFADEPLARQITDQSGQRFCLIEPNQFWMGATDSREFRHDHSDFNTAGDDQPRHPVILTRPFYMAATEVTVGQFKAFVEATGYVTESESNAGGVVGWRPIDHPSSGRPERSFESSTDFTWRDPGFPQTADHPVVGVSHNDALAYCQWMSSREKAMYRLPTEAEWECACRAGTDTLFSFGDDYRNNIARHANLGNSELERAYPGRVLNQWLVDPESQSGDKHVFTAPVGSYQSNPWGLHDMHGNVWEWCEDNFLDTSYRPFKSPGYRKIQPRAVDPLCTDSWQDDGSWKVIRGGSWYVSPVQCQSSVRGYFEASDAACYVGFRVVRDPSESVMQAATQKYEAHEAADAKLRTLARATMEAHPGVIRYEIDCESIGSDDLSCLTDLLFDVELDLRPPGKITNELVEQVCQTPRLVGITIRSGGDSITSGTFAPLAQHPELRWVQITGTGNLDDSLLQWFEQADQLETLHLQGDGITDAGLDRLPPLTTLRSISLSTTQCTGSFLHRHAESPLETVHLSAITDSTAELLAKFQSIRELNLADSPITESGLQDLARIRSLRSLSLRGNRSLDDANFESISKLRKLERLDLSDTLAADVAAASCKSLNELRSLSLDGRLLSDQGMRSLCEIPSLHDLSIDGKSQITDASVGMLWRLQNLRSLSLRSSKLVGNTLDALLELPHLKSVRLESPTLNETMVKRLQQARPDLRIRER